MKARASLSKNVNISMTDEEATALEREKKFGIGQVGNRPSTVSSFYTNGTNFERT